MLSHFLRVLLAAVLLTAGGRAAEPLRVFIRAGVKTHGPGQHDHPRFLTEWTKLLTDRGVKVSGGLQWPTERQFAASDVVLVYAQDPWDVNAEQRAAIERFARRGGSFVVIHDGLCGHKDPDWVRSLLGGAWRYGTAKWFEGDFSFYYVDNQNPITLGASNFDVTDEMYYDLEMAPEAKVLAATWTPDAKAQQNGRAFPSIYNVAPQMWTYEKDGSRAFVDLLGHNLSTFELPQVRAVLLRGLAWAGRRENIDEFCSQDELASLRYPPGGPSRPIDSLAKFSLQPDFKISLVAAEPLVNKPIAIDWDARGRMWVAETVEYPNGRRGLRDNLTGMEWKDRGSLVPQAGAQDRPALDRISILTDTDGDGIADKKEVFYEGLDLVTGFVFYKDGVIASAAPDIWLLRDTTGSGHADKVEKLYTGLGTRDTHAVINNLRWGFDGWIYATHGYSSSDHVTSADGRIDFGRIGSGVVRFKPDGSAIEQYSSKGGNAWGLDITPENQVFWTQPTSGDLILQTILSEDILARGKIGDTPGYKVVTKSPKSYPLMTWEQQAYRQIDFVGSFTAAAGCALYDGGSWPAKYNRNFFCTEPTINIVHHEILEPDGVSFAGHKEPGREETEFLRSSDMWFRPIEVRVGPDGALYVLDFYTQAVIHNDTRGPAHNNVNAAVRPDRDHYFGRVWRIDQQQAAKLIPPDLSHATVTQLIDALESRNGPVAFTAQRLLLERALPQTADLERGESAFGLRSLRALAIAGDQPASARIHALWILWQTQNLDEPTVQAALAGMNEDVTRNALKILADSSALADPLAAEILAKLNDPNPRTQLAAILAVGALSPTPEVCAALTKVLAAVSDPYLQSAALASATHSPVKYIAAALAHASEPVSDTLQTFLGHLASSVRTEPAPAAKLVELLAAQPVPLAASLSVLHGLAQGSRPVAHPEWSPELQTALGVLLQRSEAEAGAVVPLALAWDKQGGLTNEITQMVAALEVKLFDASRPEPERARLVGTLVAARRLSSEILPAINRLLGSDAPAALQKEAIRDLGATREPETGALLVASYPKLTPSLQGEALAQLLKRAAWTRLFVEALKARSIPLSALGPIATDKLRHYPDLSVAKLASATLDALRQPVTQQKDQLIASLLGVVEEGGQPQHGHELFVANCAVCHRFNGQGGNVAPDLTGMGAHPRAELLTDIVDPNREVDPSFIAYDFEMKSGERFEGIVARENSKTVLIRDAAGEHELNKSEIAGRSELGRSLMPEGFESLGAENLRDIIAYLQSGDARFRVIDLRKSFTADSRHGLFDSPDRTSETLMFKRFGDVRVGDVPFVIVDPSATHSGKNLIVLKGGHGEAKTYPQKVEIPVDRVQADVLEILGGVGGWAFPCCGDEKFDGLPVVKVTVVYEGGATEELVFKNGVEFADYSRPHEVAGSKLAPGLVNGQQVRVIREPLKRGGVIEKLILESYDNRVAPVFVAITAEKLHPHGKSAQAGPESPATSPDPSQLPARNE